MRSVLDIDVHDEKWKKFVESFKEYQGDTAKLNEVWKHFDVAVNKPRMAAEALDKAIKRAGKSSDAMHKTWAKVGASIEHSNKGLSKFERTIHGVERGLSRVGRLGLSLGKFSLAAGGIGIAGGLFGLDMLANAAMQRQKGARGLGMPIGQVSAFQTYMTPYLGNPTGTLSAIINARRTPQGMAALAALGFSPAEYDNPNLNRLKFAEQVEERVRSLYLNARTNEPGVPIESILKAYHVQTLGFGLEDARRLANTSNGELRGAFARMGTAARQLQVPDNVASNWAKLSVQLKAAGIEIETALTNKLVKLAPLIGELSGKIVKFIDRFVNSKDVTSTINAIGTGLKDAAQFLESKEFRNDLKELGSAAAYAAHEIREVGAFAKNHGTAIKYGAEAAGGWWILKRLSKGWKTLSKPIGADAASAAESAGPAIGAGVASFAALIGGLLYPHALANGDMPMPKRYYRNPKDWRAHNNPGNIDPLVNGVRVYQGFPTMAAGYQAMARTVLGYRANTVSGIVSSYEGKNAPHLAEHIDRIAQWMHVSKTQKLNLKNENTLAHLVTGLAEFENPHRQSMKQLYNTIRDAIHDGMQSVTIHAHSPAGARLGTSMHAAKY